MGGRSKGGVAREGAMGAARKKKGRQKILGYRAKNISRGSKSKFRPGRQAS